jgi:hypothetical protein
LIQIITPDPHIPCRPGWCLQYVRQAFGLPAAYPTATAAWEASQSKHRGRDFPTDMWIPVWYALANEPAGHVVLLAPDGTCYSTSDPSTIPRHHPNLADLEWYYAKYGMTLTYRGWTEDVAGYPVVGDGGISPQGTINTEGFLMALSDEEQGRILAAADRIMYTVDQPRDKVLTTAHIPEIAEAVVNRDIPWFGFDGNQPQDGRTTTTLALTAGYADSTTIGLHGAIAGLKELVSQLSVKQGVTIDYAAVAKAVNDDQAERMAQ